MCSSERMGDIGLEGNENGKVVRSERHFGPPLGAEQQLGRDQCDIGRGRAARLREASRIGAIKHYNVGRVDLASKRLATGSKLVSCQQGSYAFRCPNSVPQVSQ